MEATLRAASELVTGKPADRLEFTEVRAVEGLRETYVAIGERNIHVGVANGLTNAKMLLDKVKAGEEPFHVIEVMACPGGCIGGGGQPYPPEGVKVLDPELLRKRAGALYAHRQRQEAPQVVREPGHRGGLRARSWAGRARRRPTSCCTPIITPEAAARASDERRRHQPTMCGHRQLRHAAASGTRRNWSWASRVGGRSSSSAAASRSRKAN